MRKLLVTTALEESYIEGREAVLLGEWCKRYKHRALWNSRTHEVLPYHWELETKREADYRYLEEVYDDTVTRLATALNACHGLDHPRRYWETLVGGWLAMYVASLFDRWEAIRLAFAHYSKLDTVRLVPELEVHPSDGRADQEMRCAADDRYNYSLFWEIIRDHYAENREFVDREANSSRTAAESTPGLVATSREKGIRHRNLWRRSAKWAYLGFAKLQNRNDFAFVGSYFDLGSLCRLNLLLGQVPRLYHEFARPAPPRHQLGQAHGLRVRLEVELTDALESRSAFESFLMRRIIRELPWPYLEGLSAFRSLVGELGLRC